MKDRGQPSGSEWRTERCPDCGATREREYARYVRAAGGPGSG